MQYLRHALESDAANRAAQTGTPRLGAAMPFRQRIPVILGLRARGGSRGRERRGTHRSGRLVTEDFSGTAA